MPFARIASILLCLCLFLLAGCSSTGKNEPSPSPVSAVDKFVRVDPVLTSFSPESFDPSPIAVNPILTNQNPESSTLNTSQQQQIVVSKEVFTKTFSAVEALIDSLNVVVRNKDYKSWVVFLSDDYRNKMSSSDTLKQLSDSPTLQRLGVNLKTLEDYFSFVVVPSRANMRLDDLVFLSETDVEAIMIVGNRRVTVYRLIKIGDQWKIGPS